MFLFIIFSDVFAKVILFLLANTKKSLFFASLIDFKFSDDVFFSQCDMLYLKKAVYLS